MTCIDTLIRFSRHVLVTALAAVTLCVVPASAWALDVGAFRILSAPGQRPVAEIELRDKSPVDPASIRARIATPEAYQVAGLRYHPGLAAVRITARASNAQGSPTLVVEGLPADANALDLLVTVSDRLSLSMAEYRVDFQIGPREVAPAPAGTYLATQDSPATAASRAATPGPATAPIHATVAIQGAPAPTPASTDGSVASARAALGAWAKAWSDRDFDRYVSAYAPDFSGDMPAGSHNEWVELRRSRILGRHAISVDISNLKIERDGAVVKARFTQRYKGDGYRDTTHKRIDFAAAGDRWLIVREATVR
jgi:hypothetical protein